MTVLEAPRTRSRHCLNIRLSAAAQARERNRRPSRSGRPVPAPRLEEATGSAWVPLRAFTGIDSGATGSRRAFLLAFVPVGSDEQIEAGCACQCGVAPASRYVTGAFTSFAAGGSRVTGLSVGRVRAGLRYWPAVVCAGVKLRCHLRDSSSTFRLRHGHVRDERETRP